MSTQTERCVCRKSSGRCGQGMRLNQVNFTGILRRVPRLALGILLGLLGAALALPARAERVFLEVDVPRSGDAVHEPINLVEVRGWAGTGLRGKHDVVIVLDRSGSTFRASGVDVDGDGIVGRQFPGEPPDEILLLSAGAPASPPAPAGAAQRLSVHAARNAARAHARIYAYALGPPAAVARDRFDEIVRANGGELLVLDHPADIIEFVPYLSWTSIAKVRLENTTNGEVGRAMRLFPDGSFDGFAPLQRGRNELRLTATSQGGAEASATCWVSYDKALPDPEKLARFRKMLEVRAIETELAERASVKREERLRKQLEIKPER